MPIKNWSTTAANNNSAPPNGAPEGQAPSTVNDCIRQVMTDVRSDFEDAQWKDLGHTPTRVDDDTFTFGTGVDLTTTYHVGRRLKFTGGSTGYATIASSTFLTPTTTVNVTMDSGLLPNPLTTVAVSILTATNSSVPTAISFLASDRLLGRDTAGSGTAEQLTVGGGVEFTGTGGIQRSALTGNVTAAAGSNATAIANDVVSNAMLANVSQNSVKGRITAGVGDPEDLTPAQLVAIITTADGAGSGLDADLLDGSSSAAFATAAHTHGNADLTGYTAADVLAKLLTVDGAGSLLDADLLDGNSSAAFAAAAHTHGNADLTGYTAADVLAKLLTVDGAGSGLDADLLDGQSSAAFVQSTSGSFVATLTGFVTNPTGTVQWRRTGHLVTLYTEADIIGTSNASTMTMTDLPAALIPIATQHVSSVRMSDSTGGAGVTIGSAQIVITTGIITFSIGTTSGGRLITSAGAWAAAGIKGLGVGWSITYAVN